MLQDHKCTNRTRTFLAIFNHPCPFRPSAVYPALLANTTPAHHSRHYWHKRRRYINRLIHTEKTTALNRLFKAEKLALGVSLDDERKTVMSLMTEHEKK